MLCVWSPSEKSLLHTDQSFLFCSKMCWCCIMTTLLCCSTLFKSLSARFHGRLAFAQISKQSSSLAEAIPPEQLPLLVVKQPGQDGEHRFEGKCWCLPCAGWLLASLELCKQRHERSCPPMSWEINI